MKTILILAILIVGGYFGWQAIQTKPNANVPQATVTDTQGIAVGEPDPSASTGKVRPIDNENVSITFKGFGPGKVHNGSFGKVTSNLMLVETGGMKGEVSVDMTSMTTEIEAVTKDLKSSKFFDIAKYPTIKFVLAGIKDNIATGSMTMHGVTKTVNFPVTYSDTDMTYKTTFTLDMKDFGIDQTLANETIEISAVVPLK